MKERIKRILSVISILMMMISFATIGANAEDAEILHPSDEELAKLVFIIDGPDDRMPMTITYGEFTDGKFLLEDVMPGIYTVSEIDPDKLLADYTYDEAGSIQIATVEVTEDGEASVELKNAYEKEKPPEEEEFTSVTIRKIWNDNNNAGKIRPEKIKVKLSNGMSVELSDANGWTATITHLPKEKDGKKIVYKWSEPEILGYMQTQESSGSVTVLINTLKTPPSKPPQGTTPPQRGEPEEVIEDFETPLGVEIIINHVGDCFD